MNLSWSWWEMWEGKGSGALSGKEVKQKGQSIKPHMHFFFAPPFFDRAKQAYILNFKNKKDVS